MLWIDKNYVGARNTPGEYKRQDLVNIEDQLGTVIKKINIRYKWIFIQSIWWFEMFKMLR